MKEENELTVLIECSYEKLNNILISNGFKVVQKEEIMDLYMVKSNVDISNTSAREILKECILIRNMNKRKIELIYKFKNIADNGDIITQKNTKCKIENIEDGLNFMKAIGYNELFKIHDKYSIYVNDNIELAVQVVNDKYVFIEIELYFRHINKIYKNLEELKKELEKYNLPYDKNNYFAKKAEIILNEYLNFK